MSAFDLIRPSLTTPCMAGSTRWECIKDNLHFNMQPLSYMSLTCCLRVFGAQLQHEIKAAAKIHTQSENTHQEKVQSSVLIPKHFWLYLHWISEFPGASFTLGLWSHWRQWMSHSCKVLWSTAPERVVKHILGWPWNEITNDWGFVNTQPSHAHGCVSRVSPSQDLVSQMVWHPIISVLATLLDFCGTYISVYIYTHIRTTYIHIYMYKIYILYIDIKAQVCGSF